MAVRVAGRPDQSDGRSRCRGGSRFDKLAAVTQNPAAVQFENDVFVSYAHIDDQVLAEGQTGWISALHRALEVRLGQLLGKGPRIWRDPKLQGNDVFADRLLERLPQVAVLVSVLSPRYVKSEWCQRELTEFLKACAASGGARVADRLRAFKVVKTHDDDVHRPIQSVPGTSELRTGRRSPIPLTRKANR